MVLSQNQFKNFSWTNKAANVHKKSSVVDKTQAMWRPAIALAINSSIMSEPTWVLHAFFCFKFSCHHFSGIKKNLPSNITKRRLLQFSIHGVAVRIVRFRTGNHQILTRHIHPDTQIHYQCPGTCCKAKNEVPWLPTQTYPTPTPRWLLLTRVIVSFFITSFSGLPLA